MAITIPPEVADLIKAHKVAAENQDKSFDDALAEIRKEGGVFGPILEKIGQFFKTAFAFVWSGFRAAFAGSIGIIESFFRFDWLIPSDEDITRAVNLMSDQMGMDKDDEEHIIGMLKGARIAAKPLTMLMFAYLAISSMTNFLSAATGSLVQKQMARFSPNVPAPESIIRASFLDPKLHDQAVDAMRRAGLSDNDIKLMFTANYLLYSEEHVRDMFYRGILSPGEADHRLSELGFTPERISELKARWPIIPPLQDIITMLAHEAFEPAMIAKFGLGAEYPQAQLEEWSGKLGLKPEWAQKYWISHWDHPSLTLVLEMYHRDIIKWEDVYEFMKVVELPPYWRDKIKEVAYRPFTRVDVRRMHKVGVVDDAGLIRAYMDLGYDKDKATDMADFTKLYNAGTEKELTKAEVLKGFEDGDLSFAVAVELLTKIGYDTDTAGYLVSAKDLQVQRDVRLEKIKVVKDKYIKNMISATDTRNKLLRIDVAPARISELIDHWDVQRFVDIKMPSKTDMDKFLRNEIIDAATYVVEMKKLGYGDKYITWYQKLIAKGAA